MKMSKYTKYKILSVLSVLAFLIVWELATDVFHLIKPYSLPSPIKVLNTFVKKMYSTSPDGSTLPQHIWASLQVALLGFCAGSVIGIPLGILMAWYRPIDRIVRPVFDLIRPIPPVGLIPIMVLVFGIGLEAKVAVIFFSSFIPCVINAYSGIKQTKDIHLWVARTFGASNRQMLFTIAIPTAMPMIFTGFRVALGSAWMSLVAAELLAATRGVGYMIHVSRTIGRADVIVVGMLVIGIIGSLLSGIFEFLEKKFVRGELEK